MNYKSFILSKYKQFTGGRCVSRPGCSSEEDDVQNVVYVASVLQVSEFDVFRLAYHEWFGHPAERREMEACFHRYLGAMQAPVWVRAFVRRIRQLAEEGRLDLRAFGLEPPSPASKARIILGFTVLAGILMFVAFLIYAAFRLEMPIGITCQLPPCY
jgi:hypothetical protein